VRSRTHGSASVTLTKSPAQETHDAPAHGYRNQDSYCHGDPRCLGNSASAVRTDVKDFFDEIHLGTA